MTGAATLGVLLALAAIALGTAIGWTLAAMASRLLLTQPLAARTRALVLAQVRLLPLSCVVILVQAEVAGFVRYESGVEESAGVMLWTTAAMGIALVLQAIWRAGTAWRETARVIAAWKAAATPLRVTHWRGAAWAIPLRFPIVAVAGVFRPQLFVARQVVRTCSRDELAAIAAHEAAHVSARDNLIRALFRLTPGATVCARLADRLEREWNSAAEQAADALAARSTSAIDLASALTKVARLASPAPLPPLMASGLIDGADLPSRVHRLLESSNPARRHPAGWLPTLSLIAAATAFQSNQVLVPLHELFELLVRR